MDGQDRELERYIIEMSSPEDELLRELDRETNLKVVQPRMLSGHIQGMLLEMITRMIRPQYILEIGTFTGYSTLCFAAGLAGVGEGGRVDTIEVDDELRSISSSCFAKSRYAEFIEQHTGSALEIAPKLGRRYDLVFIDGDKREYPEYYKMIMGDGRYGESLVASGSIILADNILWYGKVVQPLAHNDLYTKRILEFNQIVKDDDRVESVVLPLRDGINMIRVK